MSGLDQRHPLVLRHIPVTYTSGEVLEALELLEMTKAQLAAWIGISDRTMHRMTVSGADKANAAALNARLRLAAFGLAA